MLQRETRAFFSQYLSPGVALAFPISLDSRLAQGTQSKDSGACIVERNESPKSVGSVGSGARRDALLFASFDSLLVCAFTDTNTCISILLNNLYSG